MIKIIKICVIGQFPPPLHGLSIALKTIIDNKKINEKYITQSVNINDNKKILKSIKEILNSNADLYYFTISQSKVGNLRDMMLLKIILLKKKKIVIHYHGGYYKQLYNKMNFFQKWINRKLISQIDIMVALGESLKDLFVDVIESKKIRVCENYVEDVSLINNNLFTRKIQQIEEKENLDVLFLSNFIESKGYMEVLEAAKKMQKEKCSFHFAGAFFNEADKKEFEKYIKDNDIEKNVYFHGVVKGKEKKELLKSSDIFVLPTFYPNEGQPISIIEAMGNGLTIITTNHAGIPDIVKKNNGIFVNPRASDEIVQSIQRLNSNRRELVSFAKNNRSITLERFREIHYIQRIDRIFEEAINR